MQNKLKSNISANYKPVLAGYAVTNTNSLGRIYQEEEDINRSYHRRDCDRIIHSTAFRRLEYKTQVFVNHEGDHYRTRLTHSLEVAQIARAIARNLNLNEDLAEALALSHDLGHPPFGHAGESALNDVAKIYGGFDHNAQSLRIITHLENKYAEFPGLNLSFETVEGLIKHNGPYLKQISIPDYLRQFSANYKFDLMLNCYPSCEAQIASLADDIAYMNHDIDDGLRSGILKLEDIKKLPLLDQIFAELEQIYPNLELEQLIHEVIRRMIFNMIGDITNVTNINIKELGIKTLDDVRECGKALVHFSEKIEVNRKIISKFLFENLYMHYKVNRMTSKGKRLLKDLFQIFFKEPECLPGSWRKKAESASTKLERATIIKDYIAGMTDRFAIAEHRNLFDLRIKS